MKIVQSTRRPFANRAIIGQAHAMANDVKTFCGVDVRFAATMGRPHESTEADWRSRRRCGRCVRIVESLKASDNWVSDGSEVNV